MSGRGTARSNATASGARVTKVKIARQAKLVGKTKEPVES
jgi:hypothetical protein